MNLPGGRKGKPCRRWTIEEEHALRLMRQQKKTLADIAAAIGRTPAAISLKINVLGLGAPIGNARNRPCMCCGSNFRSEGFHNRLCAPCRKQSFSPYAA